MGEIRNANKILFVKPEWKRPLRRSKHSWKDNIIMGLEAMDWSHVAQDRD